MEWHSTSFHFVCFFIIVIIYTNSRKVHTKSNVFLSCSFCHWKIIFWKKVFITMIIEICKSRINLNFILMFREDFFHNFNNKIEKKMFSSIYFGNIHFGLKLKSKFWGNTNFYMYFIIYHKYHLINCTFGLFYSLLIFSDFITIAQFFHLFIIKLSSFMNLFSLLKSFNS